MRMSALRVTLTVMPIIQAPNVRSNCIPFLCFFPHHLSRFLPLQDPLHGRSLNALRLRQDVKESSFKPRHRAQVDRKSGPQVRSKPPPFPVPHYRHLFRSQKLFKGTILIHIQAERRAILSQDLDPFRQRASPSIENTS
jgi:hypothetical protein